MDISSVATTLVTAATNTHNKATEHVEGNKPDGDGDRDDTSQAVSPTTGSLGSQIDITV